VRINDFDHPIVYQGRGFSGFWSPLQVEAIDANTWVLLCDLVYEGEKGDWIRVEAGEETDFATVPNFLQSIMARTGAWTKAAVIHDMLCNELNLWHGAKQIVDEPAINAVDADGIFRSIMRRSGVGPIRRRLAWTAVRWAALANPARRAGWLSTAPAVLGTSAVFLAAVTGLLALITWLVPW
jgi:hypothetical protein